MIKHSWSILLAVLVLAGAAGYGQSRFLVATWGGNSPEWNRALGVSAIRIGCSDRPASCLKQVDEIARTQGVSRVYLAVLLKPGDSPADFALYGREGSAHRNLGEVGFDDFVSQAGKSKLGPEDLSALVEGLARSLASGGGKLDLGVTIYRDQLQTGELDRLGLGDGARRSVGLVHLYPHYRKERRSLAEDVAAAKRAFPGAKVILGSYAYDRREYLPCAAGTKNRCAPEEETSLFESQLKEELGLVQSGDAIGIEFFPGNFGSEEGWKGWDNPRSCKDGGRAECVELTRQMRKKLRDAMSSLGR